MDLTFDLLAQLPSSYVFINPFKLAGVAAVMAVWALFAQWVDKDTIAVNTYRTLWNLVWLGLGALALVLALFVPLFAVGFPSMVGLVLVVSIVYVIHRNKKVREEDRVFTPAHFRRLKAEGFSGKKKVKEVKERVRLTGANRKVVAIPEEDDEREQYRLTQDLIFDALWRRAAIIEVLPGKEAARITYTIDGVPTEREALVRAEAEAVVLFLKRIAGLNLEERRKPQRGEIMAAVGDNKHKVAVRTDGSTAGEKLTLRIFYNEITLKIPDLGFTPRQLEAVQAVKETSPGLVLLSAPSGGGLTTSLYSFIRTHDRFLQNVQTIEHEKELDLDNVTQKVFSTAEGKTFTETLLKLVRSDPDIIMLPELRDRESAAVACQAAGQKQKVYVGLMAISVADALRKWLTLVGDKALVAKCLLAVANQRLVRVLCTQCKQAYKPEAAMMRKLNLPADKALYRPPEPEYDKHGNPIVCQACQGTGYVGRTAVYDWLPVNDPLREVIRKVGTAPELDSAIAKVSAGGLQARALEKVLEGITSIQEVARAVRGDAPPAPRPAGPASPGPGPGKAVPRPKPRPADGGGKAQPAQGR